MSAAPLLPHDNAIEALPRKRFTREEVDRLRESGFFEGHRYELIDGDLIDKMGQNPRHASAIQLTLIWLAGIFGLPRVRGQLPIEASSADRTRSLPEPDLAVLLEHKPEFTGRHPRGEELLLAVEVADFTAAFDLSRKAVIYAAAGVPEYWVLDLNRRMLVMHRQPSPTGYRLIQLFSESDTVSLENRGETVRVAELLPPE
ncbi:MAG TPA: Uma2 family endonuclease [Bryobacteraceae bacterium]|nr:Uma2 family endonuclease [Bryobacteraceae bacterium]